MPEDIKIEDPLNNPEWTENQNRRFESLDHGTGFSTFQIRHHVLDESSYPKTESGARIPTQRSKEIIIDRSKLGPREKIIADRGPHQVEEEMERLRAQDLTEEEQQIGLTESKRILDMLEHGQDSEQQ